MAGIWASELWPIVECALEHPTCGRLWKEHLITWPVADCRMCIWSPDIWPTSKCALEHLTCGRLWNEHLSTWPVVDCRMCIWTLGLWPIAECAFEHLTCGRLQNVHRNTWPMGDCGMCNVHEHCQYGSVFVAEWIGVWIEITYIEAVISGMAEESAMLQVPQASQWLSGLEPQFTDHGAPHRL